MSAILWLIANPGALIALLGTAAGALAAVFFKGRSDGRQIERDRQAAAEARARDIADQVDNDHGAMTAEQRREALRKWQRH